MSIGVEVKLIVENHNSQFELKNIINIFKPDMKMDYTIISRLDDTRASATVLKGDGSQIDVVVAESTIETIKEITPRQGLKKTLYTVLSEITGKKMPWGILTGIRPTKIVHNYKDKKYSEAFIEAKLMDVYCISREKVNLMMEIARKEEEILSGNKEEEISLYIGIPFCPTRCLYCSFTSYSLEENKEQVGVYLDALIKEIQAVAASVQGKPIRSLYIGGGTPTSLDNGQLERLLKEVEKCFNIEEIEEYTIEAGRPDTLNRHKLKLMKQYKVDRISINPQTMSQKTLDGVGRSHTVEDIVDTFYMAREECHDNINMDLIIGLPGETQKDVENTMRELEKLQPDSITVHTMAIKRASRLKEQIEGYDLAKVADIEKMLQITAKGAKAMGMEAYYMYRQKDILGNFENVGYAIPGKESIYNIQMIAEQQTIIAMGAGAISKEISPSYKKIKRIPNVKNLEQYIDRIDEMIDRKGL